MFATKSSAAQSAHEGGIRLENKHVQWYYSTSYRGITVVNLAWKILLALLLGLISVSAAQAKALQCEMDKRVVPCPAGSSKWPDGSYFYRDGHWWVVVPPDPNYYGLRTLTPYDADPPNPTRGSAVLPNQQLHCEDNPALCARRPCHRATVTPGLPETGQGRIEHDPDCVPEHGPPQPLHPERWVEPSPAASAFCGRNPQACHTVRAPNGRLVFVPNNPASNPNPVLGDPK